MWIKGVVVGQGDTYFHVENFGQEALHSADQLRCDLDLQKAPGGDGV